MVIFGIITLFLTPYPSLLTSFTIPHSALAPPSVSPLPLDRGPHRIRSVAPDDDPFDIDDRNALRTALRDHLFAFSGILFNVMLDEAHAHALQEIPRLDAVRAPARLIQDDIDGAIGPLRLAINA